MPRCSASEGEEIRTSSPAMRIVPESGWYIPDRMFINVVLPAPFSPRTAWISPGQRSSEMRLLAKTGPNRLVMSRISTMGRRSECRICSATRRAVSELSACFAICAIVAFRSPLLPVVVRGEGVTLVLLRIVRVEDLAADLFRDVLDSSHRVEQLQWIGVQTHQYFVFQVMSSVGRVDGKDHWRRVTARTQDDREVTS